MTQYEIDKINKLPAKEYIMDWFRQRVPSRKGGIPIIKAKSIDDRIMILQSGTGSGKSVTLGPELFINFNFVCHLYCLRINVDTDIVLYSKFIT